MLVTLAEKDTIVNAPRIRKHLDYFGRNVRQIYWTGEGHGCCVTSPTKWREIKKALLQQELSILQQARD